MTDAPNMFNNYPSANTSIWSGWMGVLGNPSAQTITATNNVFAPQIWTNWVSNSVVITATINTQTVAQATIGAEVWSSWTFSQFERVVHREQDQIRMAAENLRRNEETAKQRVVQEAARKKARKLLFDHLDEEQRREVTEFKRFHMRSRSGRLFRVLLGGGRHGNIKEIVGDKAVASICAAPAGMEIPEDDAILAQKLSLQFDEEEFLKISNITRIAA